MGYLMEKSLLLNFNDKEIEFHLHETDKNSGEGLGLIFRGITYPIVKKINPEIIFDVGANIGAASAFFSMNYPKAQIYSFEPTIMNFSLLSKNMKNFDNVRIYNKGAHEHRKIEKIYLDNEIGGRNSIHKSWTKTNHYEEVELINLADFLKSELIKKIDILKIDTEGCEVPILKTLIDFYQSLSVVYVEYHSGNDKIDILRLLNHSHFVFADRVRGRSEALLNRKLIGKKYFGRVNKSEKLVCKRGEIITSEILEKLFSIGTQRVKIIEEGLGEMILVNKDIC